MKRLFLFLLATGFLCAQTAKFPSAIATDNDLLVGKDRSASTLSSGIDASTLSIPVVDGSVFVQDEVITIDQEQMLLCSVAGNSLTVCSGGRGFAGTSATTHDSGANVRGHITAWHHNALREEIQAIETQIGEKMTTCTAGRVFFAGSSGVVDCDGKINWTTSTSVLGLERNSADMFGPQTQFRKRGTTGTPSGAVVTNDELGSYNFLGWDGTIYGSTAYFVASAKENFTSSAWGGRFKIYTTTAGTTTSVGRLSVEDTETKVLTGTLKSVENVDFSAATGYTRPLRRLAFASFPGTCTAEQDVLVRSDPVSAGQVAYICNASGDGWDLIGDGGGASGYQTIQDETTPLTQRTAVNFTGTGVTCVDNAGNTRTDCTIPGGGGAARYELEVTRTDANTLTINPNCSSSTPCNIKGNQFTSSATVDITAGSASDSVYVYLNTSGAIIVGYNSANTYTCSGCTSTSGITSFPSSAVPGSVWPVTTATFDSALATFDKRSFLYEKETVAGTGVSVTDTYGKATISIDSAVVPFYSTGAGVPSGACTAGTRFYLDTTNHNGYYCTDTDTWEQIDGTGGGGAPTTAQYVTLALDGTLSAERILDARDALEATDAGANGNISLDFNPVDRSAMYLKDEFMSFQEVSELGWKTLTTGTYVNVNGEANHPGIRQMTTAATTDSSAGIFIGQATNDPKSLDATLFTSIGWEAEWIIKLTATTNTLSFVGISDTVGATDYTKAGFRYNSAGSANWRFYTCRAHSCTDTDSTVAASTDWVRLRLRSTVGGTIKYSINGGSETDISGATVPNIDTGLVFFTSTLADEAKDLQADWFAMKWRGLSR